MKGIFTTLSLVVLFAFGCCTGANYAHFQERDLRCKAIHPYAETRGGGTRCVIPNDSTFTVPAPSPRPHD